MPRGLIVDPVAQAADRRRRRQRAVPRLGRRDRLLARHPRRARPDRSGAARDHWLVEDYYDPDPTAPDKTYARRGAFLDPVDFDPLAWGVPPSIVPATDTAQLLALIVAQRVLDDATAASSPRIDRSRVSVILGVTSAQELLSTMVSRLQRPVWVKALREAGLPEAEVQTICDRIAAHYVAWQESTFPGLLGNVVAGRIANRFDLGGTNCVTDAACASSFSALSMAVNELLARPVRPGDHRRRRHAERHLHVHVLQQDAGAVPDRRLPAVLRRGRRHHARRGAWHGRPQAPRRRRARRRPHLRRDPRRRLVLRRPRQERLRAAARGPGAGAAPRLRRGRLRRRTRWSWSRPTAPAPRPATRPSSRRSPRCSTTAAAATASGARSARSSRRSATPRRPPARRACSRR